MRAKSSNGSGDEKRRKIGALLREQGKSAQQGNVASIETLWLAFIGIARQLAALPHNESRSLDHELLFDVLGRFQRILKVALTKNDRAALQITLAMTEQGCLLLKETAQRDCKFVSDLAEGVAFWPVMLATKRIYHERANKDLTSIGVGKGSIPPTARGTGVESDNRWTQLAVMLIEKIKLYRELLLRWNKGAKWRGPVMCKSEQELRITEAKEFASVLKLPPVLNPHTYRAWWKDAKRILHAYWRSSPEQAAKDLALFKTIRSKTPKTYAVQRILAAFRTIAEKERG